MKYLLDTHVLIWFFEGNKKLSNNCKSIISNNSNDLVLSVASIWEMIIKIKLGRLEIGFKLENFDKVLESENIDLLGIEYKHLNELKNLPQHHKDPFDHLIIAQSISENIPLLSKDSNFKKYDLELIW